MGWGKQIEGGGYITGYAGGVKGKASPETAMLIEALAAVDPNFNNPTLKPKPQDPAGSKNHGPKSPAL
jgi:hypothetical protein